MYEQAYENQSLVIAKIGIVVAAVAAIFIVIDLLLFAAKFVWWGIWGVFTFLHLLLG